MCQGHARFDYNHLLEFVHTFYNNRNRANQDDIILYRCIINSLTEDAKKEVKEKEDLYELRNGHSSGLLLLHQVIDCTGVDPYIEPDTIRQELAQAANKFKQLNFEVKPFHSWINTKLAELRKSGPNAHVDLRAHLVRAYRASTDARFRDYMQRQIDDNKGAQALTARQLMFKAEEQAAQMAKDEAAAALAGEGPPASSNELLALQAKLEQKIDDLKKTRKSGNNSGHGKGNGKGNGKGKSPGGGNSNKPPFPTELKTAGKPDDPTKPRVINGKKYWYCTFHDKWGEHPTSECKKKASSQAGGSQRQASGGASNSSTNGQSRQANRTVRAYSALARLAQGNDSDSTSE